MVKAFKKRGTIRWLTTQSRRANTTFTDVNIDNTNELLRQDRR
jgi:hypothetical protein